MKNKIYETMDAAVADIPDGVTILSPGFSGVGVPRNLLAALNRQGAKNLIGVSNNAGTVDENVDIGTLVEAGQMKKMICAVAPPPASAGSTRRPRLGPSWLRAKSTGSSTAGCTFWSCRCPAITG